MRTFRFAAACHPPADAEVASPVVVAEVSEASHPDIASDEYADCIVQFPCFKVVVYQEQHLHPAFPLLCLGPIEQQWGAHWL